MELDRVGAWCAAHVPGFAGLEAAAQITGGQSNPTYLLRAASGDYVLRRKPLGQLLKSAHAVDREYRVQKALAGTGVPVAPMLAYCEDATVLGAEFYVMGHVVGRGFDDPRLGQLDRADRAPLIAAMIDTLAAIHRVDLEAAGLTDYGRPGNYFRRQIDRWSRQYAASETGTVPDMDALIAALDRACPDDDGRATLVHGDYRIDNLLFAPDAPRVAAVLDWELSTIGHPFADIAAVIMQWQMPPGGEGRGLAGVDRAAQGLPTDAEVVARYAAAMEMRDIPDFGFYVAFCFFRMGAILQGVKKRALDGNAADPERGLRLGALVPDYAAQGLGALG